MHCLWALLSVRIKNSLEKNHISKSIVPRVLKFGRAIDLDDLLNDLGDKGHRSKVKVTLKNVIFCTLHSPTGNMLRVKGQLGHSQSRSRSQVKVTNIKVKGHMGQVIGHIGHGQIRIPNKGGFTTTSSCFILYLILYIP